MAKRRTGPRKRRTREHVIADLAVNHVERFVLRCGHTMERIRYDYGLDATVKTYNSRGEVESGVIWMQIKATDKLQRLKDQPAVSVRVLRKDLLSWIRELHPVVLVIYDANADRAYWLHVQQELEGGRVFELGRTAESITLRVPLAQHLDEAAVRELRRLKADFVTRW